MSQTQNGLKYPLANVKQIVKKHLFVEDDRIIDVAMAVYLANQFQADPVWLLFVTPPSNGKTELLRAFDGHDKVCFLSSMTASTLISGLKPSKTMPEPSLLPKLNDKVLILKDFTTVLSMRSEQQQEVLAQLREVYDGSYSKAFGTGVKINWSGHVGFIGATTPVYDRHYAVIGAMGDRFLLYRSNTIDDLKMGMQAIKNVGKEDEMRQEIKEAVHKFIDQFDMENVHLKKTPEDIKQMIVALACFCAYGRCAVERDRISKTIPYQPEPEGPARLAKQFVQLGTALALVHGKDAIDDEIYETLKKIGRDLISKQRSMIIGYLTEEKVFAHLNEWLKTKEIATDVSIPGPTTKIVLEDLMTVGILNNKLATDSETTAWKWQLSEKAIEMIGASEIFS